ncbi:hypothetical protein MKHDV_01142 [Halodesulfovibrio sp. MK-HDV]|nr:hypothetical protein MKHDV_01142 [Halodesulfovibrio sp. MK-HDV]
MEQPFLISRKVMERKPRGIESNVLNSRIKVLGESREALFQKGSLAAGGSVADSPKAKSSEGSSKTSTAGSPKATTSEDSPEAQAPFKLLTLKT